MNNQSSVLDNLDILSFFHPAQQTSSEGQMHSSFYLPTFLTDNSAHQDNFASGVELSNSGVEPWLLGNTPATYQYPSAWDGNVDLKDDLTAIGFNELNEDIPVNHGIENLLEFGVEKFEQSVSPKSFDSAEAEIVRPNKRFVNEDSNEVPVGKVAKITSDGVAEIILEGTSPGFGRNVTNFGSRSEEEQPKVAVVTERTGKTGPRTLCRSVDSGFVANSPEEVVKREQTPVISDGNCSPELVEPVDFENNNFVISDLIVFPVENFVTEIDQTTKEDEPKTLKKINQLTPEVSKKIPQCNFTIEEAGNDKENEIPEPETNKDTDSQKCAKDDKEPKRPNDSYVSLIARALLDAENNELPISGIYKWIESNVDFYKTAKDGWKNSVRHALSLHDGFCKFTKQSYSRGHYWTLNPAYIARFVAGDFRKMKKNNLLKYQVKQNIQPNTAKTLPAILAPVTNSNTPNVASQNVLGVNQAANFTALPVQPQFNYPVPRMLPPNVNRGIPQSNYFNTPQNYFQQPIPTYPQQMYTGQYQATQNFFQSMPCDNYLMNGGYNMAGNNGYNNGHLTGTIGFNTIPDFYY